MCDGRGGFFGGGKQLDDMLTQDLHILKVCEWNNFTRLVYIDSAYSK